MNNDHHIWRVWSDYLHRWGLEGLVASLLEAFGPLMVVGAQMVYIGQPMLETFFPKGHLEAAAHLMESSTEAEAFVSFLRKAS